MLALITQKWLKPQKQKLVTWFLRLIGNFYKKTNFSLKPTVFKKKIQIVLFFGVGVLTLITQKRLKIPTWNLVTCFIRLLGNFFFINNVTISIFVHPKGVVLQMFFPSKRPRTHSTLKPFALSAIPRQMDGKWVTVLEHPPTSLTRHP